MTLNEFKAWLDGYEASFPLEKVGGCEIPRPTIDQWENVKQKLEEVRMPGDWGTPVVIPEGALIDFSHMDVENMQPVAIREAIG